MSTLLVVVLALLVIGLVIGGVALLGGRRQPKAPPREAPSGTILDEPSTAEAPAERRPRARGARHRPSSAPRPPRAGWSGCAPGSPARRTPWARACSRCSRRERLDEDTWEEIEDTLLTADVGVAPTQELVERLRERVRVEGTDPARPRSCCARSCSPSSARRSTAGRASSGGDGKPGVVLVVGVNGSGKTTTARQARPRAGRRGQVGRPRRRRHLPGRRRRPAPDLGRAGRRHVVRGPRGRDPAASPSTRCEGVERGRRRRAHRHRRPAAHQDRPDGRARQGQAGRREAGPVDEVLLVLDATTGQNGLVQARVFREVVDVTGIVLTKLDGTAKGGIVVAVQRELGVPSSCRPGRGPRRPGAVRPRGVRRRAARRWVAVGFPC